MDTFGQQMNAKLTQHFNVADQQLKDYIVKTVHKKVAYFEFFFFTSVICLIRGAIFFAVCYRYVGQYNGLCVTFCDIDLVRRSIL